MKTKIKSVILVIFTSILMLVLNFILEYLLFFIFPGFLGALAVVQFIGPLIVLPLTIWLGVVFYRILEKQFNLGRLNIFVVLVISSLIISYTYTEKYVDAKIEEYKINKAENELIVNAEIKDEKIETIQKPWGQRTLPTKVYKFTLALDNKAQKNYDLTIEIVPGRFETSYLFLNPAGVRVYKTLNPGINLIEGEYELNSIGVYPVDGKIPLSIRMTNFDLRLDKTIYTYSSLSSWKEVFR